MIRCVTALLLTLLTTACVTGPGQHELIGAASIAELDAVPFFPQDDYQCGPAALATVLMHDGVAVTADELVASIYIPDRLGSLQAELLAATRSHGRVPYRLDGSALALLEELRSGRPVLLLQNLGFERWPVWHYAVLVGFDAEADTVLLRSGDVRRHEVALGTFLASWKLAGNWAMVAVPASEPPVTADALSWLRAVAPFESTGNLTTASAGYAAGAQRWPDDPLVWTAWGNARYLQRDFTGAGQAYGKALALAPEHWPARNNLVQVLLEQGCPGLAGPWVEAAGDPPLAFADTWKRTLEDLADTEDGQCRSAATSL